MIHEKRHAILHRGFHNIETATRQHEGALGDELADEIRTTVQSSFGTPQRQASDAAALVAIALFCGTVAILAQLAAH